MDPALAAISDLLGQAFVSAQTRVGSNSLHNQAGMDFPPAFLFPRVRGPGGIGTLYVNFLRLALLPPARMLVHNSLF